MSSSAAALALLDWRRQVAELYAEVRRRARGDPQAAWDHFRSARERLFREHPQSPNPAVSPAYFPYAPDWRLRARPEPVEPRFWTVELPEGPLRLRRFARVALETPAGPAHLALYWIEGYGGGLFLPFRDATAGRQTYGGGRYLLDTIKGADLGEEGDQLVLDFNFAYHPSCAYETRWSCPLAPDENVLNFPVPAGERLAAGDP